VRRSFGKRGDLLLDTLRGLLIMRIEGEPDRQFKIEYLGIGEGVGRDVAEISIRFLRKEKDEG
jgi:hypothetical protein